jgi:ankyrin repeat protein
VLINKDDLDEFEEILGEGNYERRIIRCVNNQNVTGLKSLLICANLDITKIVDENGFTLLHLAAYVNSDRCLRAILDHFKAKRNTSPFSDESEEESSSKSKDFDAA